MLGENDEFIFGEQGGIARWLLKDISAHGKMLPEAGLFAKAATPVHWTKTVFFFTGVPE